MNGRIRKTGIGDLLGVWSSQKTWTGLSEGDYGFTGHVVRDVFVVLRLAQSIEPDPDKLMSWYQNSRITELDSLTAEELVKCDRAQDVIRFLKAIRTGVRH